MNIDSILTPALSARRHEQLYRQRKTLQSPQATEVRVDGKNFLSFSSNDYLGLANHPDVVAALQDAAAQYGVGSGASHLVCGHSVEHHALEAELAAFCGRERALLFSSGYMANLGAINALVGQGFSRQASADCAIFADKLNHASLIDAGLLSGARFQRFLHNDMSSLESHLQKSKASRKLIVVDGVFSMDGDIAPLDQLSALADQYNAWLMVDDAHGFGCLGDMGGGSAEHFGLSQNDLPILMGTLGKAFGTAGAFVAGSEALIETLIQFSRSYIYTTALPPAIAAATRVSLALLKNERGLRQRLRQNVQQFRLGAQALGLNLMDSMTPIQPVLIGDEKQTMQLAEKLELRGILVGAIRPPTVATGSSRLRITFSAEHTSVQITQLLDALAQSL